MTTTAEATTAVPAPLGLDAVTVQRGEARPYWTPCPLWCLHREQQHSMESHNSDRYHFGDLYFLPIRDLPAHDRGGDEGGYTLGHAQMYLRHFVTHTEPEIQVDLNGTSTGIVLTLGEAENIGRTPLAMVEAARPA